MPLRLRSKQPTNEASEPKFKPRPTPAPTAFRELVRQAVDVTKQLAAMNEPRAQKLSADALRQSLLTSIQSTPERIATLRRALEKGAPTLAHAHAALRRMMTFFRSDHAPRGPVRDPGRLRFLSTPDADSELASLKSSFAELVVVAVELVAEKFPEAFGDCSDPDGFADRLAELRKRQAELFARIGTNLTAADLDIGKADAHGRSLVSFRISDGQVPIAPPDNAGERLVSYLLANKRSI